MPNNLTLRIFKFIFKLLDRLVSSSYLSYVSRLKKSDDIMSMPDVFTFKEDVSIIMQGPIINKDNFTYETLKLYRKRYPNVRIILSTWSEYSKVDLDKFYKIGVIVSLSNKPDFCGISNINLQIFSTKNGLLQAKRYGSSYCLKTRTDQRIYRHDFLSYFLSLLELYSVDNKQIKSRLIATSLNTYKYRLYGVSDMLMFGNIDDMLKYWDIDFDLRSSVDLGFTALEYSKACICEVYLCTNFLHKVFHRLDFTLKDYWSVLSKYFCIVDSSSIDLFWFKYDRWNERNRYQNIRRSLDEEFHFSDWINALNNLKNYSCKQEVLLHNKNMS